MNRGKKFLEISGLNKSYTLADFLNDEVPAEDKYDYMVYFLMSALDNQSKEQERAVALWFYEQDKMLLAEAYMIYQAMRDYRLQDSILFEEIEAIVRRTSSRLQAVA